MANDTEQDTPQGELPGNPAVVVFWANGTAQVAAINGLDTLSAPTLLRLGLKQINKALDIE